MSVEAFRARVISRAARWAFLLLTGCFLLFWAGSRTSPALAAFTATARGDLILALAFLLVGAALVIPWRQRKPVEA